MSFNVSIDIIVLSVRLSLFSLSATYIHIYIYNKSLSQRTYVSIFECNCNYSLAHNCDLLFMNSLTKNEKSKTKEKKCQLQMKLKYSKRTKKNERISNILEQVDFVCSVEIYDSRR